MIIGKENVEGYETEGFAISEEDKSFDLVFEGEFTFSLKINYCPICGRNLREARKLALIKEDFND